MNLSSQLDNVNHQSKEFLFCPTENCFNIPEISYSYNPLKAEVQYKCKCNNNYNKEMKVELNEFSPKSNVVCSQCRKSIIESKFLFCKYCNNYIHFECRNNHYNYNNHSDLDFTDKYKILNCCKEHKAIFIFRCMDCNESFCKECNMDTHLQKKHSLKQIVDLIIDKNNFEKMNSTLTKQKIILNKIKDKNNTFIQTFENDIHIKQKIINNFIDNKSNYCSIVNLNNLYLKNNEKYENILMDFINKNDEKQKNKNNDLDRYTDEILLPFYYSMMISKDESLHDIILESLENKIQKLKKVKKKNIENQHLSQNINNNSNFNRNINDLNSEIIESKNYSPNQINSNNQEISNNKISKNIENNDFSIFSFKNDISNIKEDEDEDEDSNTDKNYIPKKFNKNKHISKKKTSKEKSNSKKGKNKKNNNENDNNIRNNMIALRSGNFAISIKKKVEIYDFKKLNFIEKKDFIDSNLINKCLIQEISFDKKGKGRYINYIFQFKDQTLFCSFYSKIIRIKLLNNDKEHEIIGYINLENMELTRKMISLGNSMLAMLSDKGNYCKIKIYSKIDESANNNLNDYNIIKDEFNSIFSGIFNNNNNNQNNNNLKNEKENISSYDINKKNQVQNNNENYEDIIEDHEFKLELDNINTENIVWTSMFELVKNKNDENYLYEFILTSNTNLVDGEDWVEFYGVKKIFGKYSVDLIKKISGISCSYEPDIICQLNKNYICIGLQDYNWEGQKNGFALIDINKRELYKIIEINSPIYSLFYMKEKKMLLATMDSDNNEPNFLVRAYKFLKNNEEKNKDDYTLNEIYKYKSEQVDVIVSIHSLLIPNLNNKIIIITSSCKSNIEIVKAEIQNL